MPVYNSERYLSQAIESILSQTFDNFELIIINDGSTDNSHSIIKKYSKIDKRIRYFSQENMGIVKTLNDAILSKARGQWIARMDSDDISLERRLELQLKKISENKKIVLVGSSFDVINEYNEIIDTTYVPTEDEDIKRMMLLQNPLAHGSVVFKKEIFIKSGGYSAEVGPTEDYDLWVKFSDFGSLGSVEESVFRWRKNPDGITSASTSNLDAYTKNILNRQWKDSRIKILSLSQLKTKMKFYKRNISNQKPEYIRLILDCNIRLGIKLIVHKRPFAGIIQLTNIAGVFPIGSILIISRLVYMLKNKLS